MAYICLQGHDLDTNLKFAQAALPVWALPPGRWAPHPFVQQLTLQVPVCVPVEDSQQVYAHRRGCIIAADRTPKVRALKETLTRQHHAAHSPKVVPEADTIYWVQIDDGIRLRLTGDQAREAVPGLASTVALGGSPDSLYASLTAPDRAMVQHPVMRDPWLPASLPLAPLLRGDLVSFQDPPDLPVLGVNPVVSWPPGACPRFRAKVLAQVALTAPHQYYVQDQAGRGRPTMTVHLPPDTHGLNWWLWPRTAQDPYSRILEIAPPFRAGGLRAEQPPLGGWNGPTFRAQCLQEESDLLSTQVPHGCGQPQVLDPASDL